MATDEILHPGTVTEITPEYTTVQIVSESACSACHAKGLCGMSESKVKAVQVPTRGWDNYEVGQQVQVALKRTMGLKAVWIAYVIPLVILMGVLLGLVSLHLSELTAGLSAIGALALYYLGVWLLRDRLKNDYTFYIK